MNRRSFLFVVVAVACTRSDRAIDPVWGKQACAGCGMVVENHRTAAELVTKDGERLFFDDAGCMVVWLSKHPGAGAGAKTWAMTESGWTDATSARWSSGVSTPMDFGWTASSTGGSWDDMRTAVLEREGSDR